MIHVTESSNAAHPSARAEQDRSGRHPDRSLDAGLVLVRQTRDGFRFLLLRTRESWCLPVTHVEAGEATVAAALRAAQTSTGIDAMALRWGPQFVDVPGDAASTGVIRFHLAQTPTRRGRTPADRHSEKIARDQLWTDLGEALNLTVAPARTAIAWAASILMLDATIAARHHSDDSRS